MATASKKLTNNFKHSKTASTVGSTTHVFARSDQKFKKSHLIFGCNIGYK